MKNLSSVREKAGALASRARIFVKTHVPASVVTQLRAMFPTRRSVVAWLVASALLALACGAIASFEFFGNPSVKTFFGDVCKEASRFFVFFAIFIALVRTLPFPLRAISWVAVLLFPAFDFGLFVYTGSSAFSFVLRNALVTNVAEVLSWVDFRSVALLLLFLAVCAAFTWSFRLKKGTRVALGLKITAIVVIIFSFAFPSFVLTSPQFQNKREHKKIRSLAKSLIGNPIYHYAEVFSHARGASNFYYLETLPKLSAFPSVARDEDEALIIFLHIGESVRSRNLPLAGYARNTAPNCVESKARGNLFDFNAISFAAETTASTVAMMTDATVPANDAEPPRAAHRSFVDLLAAHKFAVAQFYCFNDIIGAYGMECVPLALLMKDFPPATREQSRTELCPKIAETAEKSPRAFMLYNERGSHQPFEFSEKFAKFTASDGSREAEYCADYDNTLLETDDFIGNTIRALGDRCFVYIFVSDHGISLGENGVFGRSGNSMRSATVRTVPLYIYVSDAFKARFPQLTANLARNRERFPTVSQEYVFHTILGLAGIRTDFPAETPFRGYCEALDLSSEKASGEISPELTRGIDLP